MKIIQYMSHNILLYKLVPLLLNNRFVHEILYFKIRNRDTNRKEREYEFRKFCEANAEKLREVEALLEDNKSKIIFAKILEYRRSGDIKLIKPYVTKPQYWGDGILKFSGHDIFVDGGAYIGDTILQFLKHANYNYDKIYAWEPDESNMKMCKHALRKFSNIQYVPCGMWNSAGILTFKNKAGSASMITDTEDTGNLVCVDSVDRVCTGGGFMIVKMDIEGAEVEALKGAEKIIRTYKPQLAICIYHKPEHLYEVVFLLKKFVPEYRL